LPQRKGVRQRNKPPVIKHSENPTPKQDSWWATVLIPEPEDNIQTLTATPQCILFDHNALKLEFNSKNNSRKHANNWKLNNTLLNDQWVIDEI
jgi:hypothetical protein